MYTALCTATGSHNSVAPSYPAWLYATLGPRAATTCTLPLGGVAGSTTLFTILICMRWVGEKGRGEGCLLIKTRSEQHREYNLHSSFLVGVQILDRLHILLLVVTFAQEPFVLETSFYRCFLL